jgi:hypothetical protein
MICNQNEILLRFANIYEKVLERDSSTRTTKGKTKMNLLMIINGASLGLLPCA